MPPRSGKQRKAQLQLKRAAKRGETTPVPAKPKGRTTQSASRNARDLQSQFVKLSRSFLEETRALAGSVILRRPIPRGVATLRDDRITPAPLVTQLDQQAALPKRPKWRYQMSKNELDANEQAYFRTWLAEQDVIVEQWQRTLTDQTAPSADPSVDDSVMPHPPTHFERNIEVWRQFWRVTEISQILLVLLDSRCPPLHLPSSLSVYLNIPTSSQTEPRPHSKHSLGSKAPRVVLVLTKVDISGPERTASWTSFLNANYPGVPIVPVEAYAPKATVEQGPTRYEPHLPGTFRERLVHTLREIHEQLLQLPPWVTTPRAGESEEERLQRIDKWKPRVKRVIDWDGVLKAKGKLVGKAVGGATVPKGRAVEHETEATLVEEDEIRVSDSEEEQTSDAYEWKEPEFLTVGVIGQPNVGKSSLLNAIFGTTRVRASRTPGKTKHFQTLFWTSDVRLVDCPGLVVPSFVPMDIQVLSGVLPISRISAVPFCVHQLARLLPLERILELTHPSISPASNAAETIPSSERDSVPRSSKAKSNSKPAPADATLSPDKRTWRPGQRPEQAAVQSKVPGWTANDIMTAYALKKGWVTAKAGRPDIHRAGNAILRLVAEGKIPWAFWPPGCSVSGDDGIWLKGGIEQYARDESENDEDSEEQDSEIEEEDSEVASEEEGVVRSGGNLGRFGALEIDV